MILHQELSSVREVLRKSPNLHMPDIKRQLRLMEGTLYSKELAGFLGSDSALHGQDSEDDGSDLSRSTSLSSGSNISSRAGSRTMSGSSLNLTEKIQHILCGGGDRSLPPDDSGSSSSPVRPSRSQDRCNCQLPPLYFAYTQDGLRVMRYYIVNLMQHGVTRRV